MAAFAAMLKEAGGVASWGGLDVFAGSDVFVVELVLLSAPCTRTTWAATMVGA